MIKFDDKERPIGVQIFGDDPEIVGKSAKYICNNFSPDIIDINYGCPVPKITKKGAGSAALKDLCRMEDITRAVIEASKKTPVTVKMRSGWDNANIVSTEAGIKLEKLGVKAITLHGRTTLQSYTGSSNWDLIKELKENIKIPVIGNGDVSSLQDYINIKKHTNCDGVMIGRAALGNPWIFNEIYCYNNNLEYQKQTLAETIKLCKKHVNLLIENKPDKVAINLSKKHLGYYIKGFTKSSIHRKEIMKIENISEILKYLESIIS
tara:strand:- start:26 stop:817 length:792 start_codon:yes stop_codon:yes gene_type:complete